MNPIRVLVVDDSVVVRRLVTDVLSEDPMIDVIGTASNGKIAVAKVDQLEPDLVTLDIEMPEMNGLEALREIRKRHPRLPIIMFSTMTHSGASATLDALSMGASDYVTKPANVGGLTEGMQAIRDELMPKVHALCRGNARRTPTPLSPTTRFTGLTTPTTTLGGPRPALGSLRQSSMPPPRTPTPPAIPIPAAQGPSARMQSPAPPPGPANRLPPRGARVDLVMIGSSTGGPNALATIWAQLPKDFPVPVIITQHMPPMFTTLFAERLTKTGTLPVTEGTHGLVLRPGHAVLAPGDHHLVLEPGVPGGRVRITCDPPVNSCRPAVDPMFQSAIKIFGGNLLGVILTGMGADGLEGCRMVRSAGGQIVTQDEETSVVWGMPGHVTQAGLSDAVLPLDRIAAEIVQRVGQGRLATSGIARRAG